MAKRKSVKNTAPVIESAAVDLVPIESDNISNSFGDAIGIGGGINPVGFPNNQGFPGTATVENVGTIFKNLRWYLISNMRQVLCQAYVELGLVQTICDVPVDDALRGGVTIKTKQLEEDQIKDLETSLDRDDDLNTAGQAAKWNRLFGGAGVLILTDQDPEEPLELTDLTEDDPLEFRAVDMWELFYDKQGTEGYDPTIQEEGFEHYSYYGERVHKSRVMRLKGLTAPSFIRPKLRGWGFSVVEALVRSLNQYLKGTDLAFEVLDEFKVDVFKIKNLVQSLMTPAGEAAIKRRVQMANWQKNYQNALTMDTEDDWDHKQLSFAGLGDAMMQIRMQVASDMRMPLTKLFGISASGFNSGEDDIEVYNAMVESQVRNKIKYTILRMIEIKCQRMFGFIPDDLAISFEPLRVMSSEQEQNIKTQKITNMTSAVQAGLLTPIEWREACNKGELLDITLDVDDEDILAAYEANMASDQGEEGDEEAGADRPDSEKPKATGKDGEGNKAKKADSAKADTSDTTDKAIAKKAPQAKKSNAFDETKVSRDDEGKFKEKFGDVQTGNEYHSSGHRDAATSVAKGLRKEGVHATIWHLEGPRTGPKSKYAVAVPSNKKNAILVMPTKWTTTERATRIVANSPTFDRKSYEADGGDAWIEPRRRYFFDRDKAKDKGTWDRAVIASEEALGQERWQFVVWWYKKQGGRF